MYDLKENAVYRDQVKKNYDKKNIRHTGVIRSIAYSLSHSKIGETLVIKGYISPNELKSALHTQKVTNKPLGQIFTEQSQITKHQLARLLFRQKMIRIAATAILCFASFGGIAKKSHAKSMKKSEVTLAAISYSNNASFENINNYPNLFGANEKRSKNLKAFTKWSSMFKRFEQELKNNNSSRTIKNLQSKLTAFKSPSIHAMAKQVNALMNKQKYIVDNKNWGKSDYWATPIEFMERGGDCEDYAIAKYVALRALGVPESRLRIAIVQDQRKNIPHAILVVYSERGPMILDNQIKAMQSANSISHYKPIFSINSNAWWLHTTQERPTTIVASAK